MFSGNVSQKERIGIIVAVAVVSVAIFDRLIISPINKKIQQINDGIKISERQLEIGLRNLSQKDIVASQYEKFRKYLKNIGSGEETTAIILSEIESLGRKSNLNLLDLKPQETKDRGFYKEYSVEMEAEGGMECLMNFIYQLNASTQLLRVEKLRLNLRDKQSEVVTASFLITKFSLP